MDGISNNEIKRIRSLSAKKFRDQYGLFTVEGEKMVQFSTPSPVLAVVRKPDGLHLSDIEGIRQALCSTGGLYLALDSIRDPGNLGTILRIADWFGIDAVFASPDTVDVFNPKVVQSTMGAIFRVRFHYADIPALAGTVFDAGGKVYGTFLDGNDIYSSEIDTGTSAPAVIVIGNESDGISPAVAGLVSDRLYIPPYPAGDPGSESLNAAVATAVTVAEFRRRNYVRRMADARKK